MKGNMMIAFPAIWWLFSVISLGLILFFLYLTKSDRLESKRLRNCFVVSGAFFGLLAFVLPFFQQPHFQNPILNYAFGLPLTTLENRIWRATPNITLSPSSLSYHRLSCTSSYQRLSETLQSATVHSTYQMQDCCFPININANSNTEYSGASINCVKTIVSGKCQTLMWLTL